MLRGNLPPGPLGGHALEEIRGQLTGLIAQTWSLRSGEARTLTVDIDLGDGRRLTGTVPSVFGNRLVNVSYSSLAAKHRLKGWLDLLALTLGHPDESWTGHTLGRGRAGTAHALVAPPDDRAEGWLREIVDLYDRGLREPLPMPGQDRAGLRRGRSAERARCPRRRGPQGAPDVGDGPVQPGRDPG